MLYPFLLNNTPSIGSSISIHFRNNTLLFSMVIYLNKRIVFLITRSIGKRLDLVRLYDNFS